MTQRHLLTAEEIAALSDDWRRRFGGPWVDQYFPLRIWLLAASIGGYVLTVLWRHEAVALQIANGAGGDMGFAYLYLGFRVVGALALTSWYVYAYARNRYFALTALVAWLLGLIQLVFDLFFAYAPALANPTPELTLSILARVAMLWLLFLNIAHARGLPPPYQRFDAWLPWQAWRMGGWRQ
jgi:hypothetical protein